MPRAQPRQCGFIPGDLGTNLIARHADALFQIGPSTKHTLSSARYDHRSDRVVAL
jgi:hypothetical protein